MKDRREKGARQACGAAGQAVLAAEYPRRSPRPERPLDHKIPAGDVQIGITPAPPSGGRVQ
jgi:hypothetical protein